jgi:hypothetical protein
MAKWRSRLRRAGGWVRKGLSFTPLGKVVDMFAGMRDRGDDDGGGYAAASPVERDVTRSGGDAAVSFRSRYNQ